MPLVPSDTDGAITRKRIEAWAAAKEKATVVALADEASTQSAATLLAGGVTVYTQTPSAGRALTTPTGAQLAAAVSGEVWELRLSSRL